MNVTSRSGQGEWGGRVLSITVSGTAGSVSLTGDTFRRAIGLRSNWFDLGGGGTTAPPSGTPASACNGRDEPPVVGTASAAPAARFSPMVPVRLVDTRDGTGTAAIPLGLGCTLQVHPQVAPGTTSVAVNIVTVDPAAQGFITAYPCGISRTFTSAVQSQPGRIVSGSVIVPLAADGSFCVFSNVATDVVIDMTGSFSPDAADRFEPIVAQRRFDSRPGGVPLNVGQVVRVATRGAGGAADDSTGASITIHALDAAVAGWIVAWPCDTPRPWASSANVNAGESVTNHVDVATGPTGEVCLMTSAPMHLAVDVNGWYGPSATTDFHSVVPVRVADTREGQAWSGQFARNVTRRISIASAGGLPGPATVRAVAVQLTAVSGTSSGWVTVHPCLPATPDVSMLRFPARTNVAVLSTDIVSASGEWCVVASAATHLVVDISGWFG